MLTTLAVHGYRSLRDVVVPLAPLTVVTGANGAGKSNLYRALRLLAATARGEVVGALAAEGGLPATLWAGPEKISSGMRSGAVPVQGTRRTGPIRLMLGFGSETYGYAIDLGLPIPSELTVFGLDPVIKAEHVWHGPIPRPGSMLARRKGPVVAHRDGREWDQVTADLPPFDSLIGQAADPRRAPELVSLREQMRAWRFYDHLRTDAAAPARRGAVGTRTGALAGDGADLAATVATLRENGRGDLFDNAIAEAFDGARVDVTSERGRFSVLMTQPGMLRPLGTDELSDGTLRFLMLAAALLPSRDPGLVVLNEPETSLHPSLLPALAALMSVAAEHNQVLVVTHSDALARSLRAVAPDAGHVELIKNTGETLVADQGLLSRPAWGWPAR